MDSDEKSDAAKLAKQLIIRGVDVEARATILSNGDTRGVEPYTASAALLHCKSAWGAKVQEIIELAVCKHGFIEENLTPLDWAAEHGALGVAKTLLSHGADSSSKSLSGKTLAHFAEKAKLFPESLRMNEKLVQLLVGAGGEL